MERTESTGFSIGSDAQAITVVLCVRGPADRFPLAYAVRRGAQCLDRDGRWQEEVSDWPQDEMFRKSRRFDMFEQAKAAALAAAGKENGSGNV